MYKELCNLCGEMVYWDYVGRGDHQRMAFGKDAAGEPWTWLDCHKSGRRAWQNQVTGELRALWAKGGPTGEVSGVSSTS